MNKNQSRRLTMLGNVTAFKKRNSGDIAAGSKAEELLDAVAAAEADATEGGTEQASGDGEARAGTQTKSELYEDLLDAVRDLSDTAKSVATEVSGLEEKFRMPRSISHTNILTTARAFLKDATPLAAEFIKFELAADFLTDLEDDIKAYDKAVDDQGDGVGKRAGATRTIAQAITDGCAAVTKLGPLMRNKYKKDPAKLAEWYTASHVERAARKAKAQVPAA